MIVHRDTSILSTRNLSFRDLSELPPIFVKTRKHLYLSVLTGNLLALCAGISFAWSSPILPKLFDEKHLEVNPLGRVITLEEASWIGSLLTFGGIFGAFIVGYSASKIGRKKSMLIVCVIPFVIAYLILGKAERIGLYYVGRLLAGVAVSGVYTLTPIYLSEVAEDAIRGRICSSMMMFETFGELFTYFVAPYLTIHVFCMTAVGITFVVAALILLYLPETPYYLLSKNDVSGAERSLMILRSNTREGVQEELNFMRDIVEEAMSHRGTCRDICRSKPLRKAQRMTLTLTIFQHFSGIIPVLIYSQSIFNATGSKIPPEICSMVIGVVQFLSSFVAPGLVDRLGRRWMLFISASGMLVSNFFLGLYFFLQGKSYNVNALFWLPVLCLVGYIVFYIIGFGPLIWTIMGELFPPNVKSAAFTVEVCFWWSMAFTVSRVFHPISDVIGMGGTFWIFAGNCLLAMIYIFPFLIETKGKSLPEIQALLNK